MIPLKLSLSRLLILQTTLAAALRIYLMAELFSKTAVHWSPQPLTPSLNLMTVKRKKPQQHMIPLKLSLSRLLILQTTLAAALRIYLMAELLSETAVH